MPIKPDYTIHGDKCHYGWNRSIEPVVKVSPGSILEIEAVDAGGGQITRDSTLEDVKNIDFEKVNPVTGPVYVDGAKPGDALRVTILSLKPSGWGWSAVSDVRAAADGFRWSDGVSFMAVIPFRTMLMITCCS